MSYHIKARLGCVSVQGHIVRDERDVQVNYINTPIGVQRFIHEQSPYVSLTIRDQSGNDVTASFVDDGIKFVKSRYNQPYVVTDLRKLQGIE